MYVSFKSRSTVQQRSGQHVCITFNRQGFMGLNDRARIRRENQKTIFFMSDVLTINTTLIFDKKYADIRSFVSLMLILIKSFHNCLKS